MTNFTVPPAAIRLWSMGQCTIEIGPARLSPEAQMRFATTLYLTIERGKRVHRGALAELLWPSAENAKRRHSLRHLIYKLRMLGAPIVERDQYLEFPSATVELDCSISCPGSPARLPMFGRSCQRTRRAFP